jgi:hypothetical protein
MPKWATPERQAELVRLFLHSGGFCVYGESPCTNPRAHHYENYIIGLIKDWVADDREARAYLNRIMSRQLHRIPEIGALRGSFNAISRDIYFESQPQYYIESLGISGITFKPFAKIRIASSFTRLHVDIAEPLKAVSKNKRRKAIRYGHSLPVEIQRQVEEICNRAIAHYLSK